MSDLTPSILAGIVGFLVGLTGVGAGAIMTPFLIIFLGVPASMAIATDLIFAVTTKLAASIVHIRQSVIAWRVALTLWKGSLPGMVIGTSTLFLLSSYGQGPTTIILSLALILTALSMLASRNMNFGLRKNWHFVLASGGLGFMVATTSVGAGALGMVLLRAKLGDQKPRTLVGTDLIHSIPLTALAGIAFGWAGLVDGQLLGQLLVTSVPAAVAGSLLSAKIGAAQLRKAIAILLLVASAALIGKVFI